MSHRIPTILPDAVRHYLRVYVQPTMCCVACGKEVSAQKVFMDAAGQAACREHNLRRCYSCGRFMMPEGVHLPGYEKVCASCARTMSGAKVQTLTHVVQQHLVNMGFVIPACKVTCLPATEMKRRHANIMGIAPLGMAMNDSEPYSIDVMAQQCRAGIIRTIAHEMMHLWLFEHECKAPKVYAEGFCNLCAALVLREFEGEDVLFHLGNMMEDKNQDYGLGFRRLLSVYYNFGLNAVVAAMREYMPACE